MPTCTIIKAGQFDEYGRPLNVGAVYDGTLDRVRALVNSGFATPTNPSDLDDGSDGGLAIPKSAANSAPKVIALSADRPLSASDHRANLAMTANRAMTVGVGGIEPHFINSTSGPLTLTVQGTSGIVINGTANGSVTRTIPARGTLTLRADDANSYDVPDPGGSGSVAVQDEGTQVAAATPDAPPDLKSGVGQLHSYTICCPMSQSPRKTANKRRSSGAHRAQTLICAWSHLSLRECRLLARTASADALALAALFGLGRAGNDRNDSPSLKGPEGTDHADRLPLLPQPRPQACGHWLQT